MAPPVTLAAFTDDLETLVGITGSYAGAGIQYIVPAALVFHARQVSPPFQKHIFYISIFYYLFLLRNSLFLLLLFIAFNSKENPRSAFNNCILNKSIKSAIAIFQQKFLVTLIFIFTNLMHGNENTLLNKIWTNMI